MFVFFLIALLIIDSVVVFFTFLPVFYWIVLYCFCTFCLNLMALSVLLNRYNLPLMRSSMMSRAFKGSPVRASLPSWPALVAPCMKPCSQGSISSSSSSSS